MMDDVIYRQDTVNELREYITEPSISDDESEIIGYNDGIELAISVLSTMPSAQQWIPCSERLPEEDGLEVLFSSRFGRVHIGKYHDDASLNRWFSYRDKIRLMNDEVTAWMPLQEPYREEAADG